MFVFAKITNMFVNASKKIQNEMSKPGEPS
jgi:hypothetical protein